MPQVMLRALADDVNRLLLAGAAAASSDERLRHRAQALRELGRRVPVLAKVAQASERVCAASQRQVAGALLDLLVLTREVLSQFALPGVAGRLEPIPHAGPWTTSMPADAVATLVVALTGRGPGRWQVVNEAITANPEADLRLLEPAVRGLRDGDAALAETVAEALLPRLGIRLLSQLREGLNVGGTAVDGRRLAAICRIDAAIGVDLCRAALQGGSAIVRLRALRLFDSAPCGCWPKWPPRRRVRRRYPCSKGNRRRGDSARLL
jgi:hypothetical protein